MTITTNPTTRTSTVVFSVAEWENLQWCLDNGLVPASVGDIVGAVDYELRVGPKGLKNQYNTEISTRRQNYYGAATKPEQQQSDAAIHFDPNTSPPTPPLV
jgi:hypothetical protein